MIKVSYIAKAECNNCKEIFELYLPLNKNTENMTMKEIIKSLFGEAIILCSGCKNKTMGA